MTPIYPWVDEWTWEHYDDWASRRFDGTSEPTEPDDAVWVERPVDESYEDNPVSEELP